MIAPSPAALWPLKTLFAAAALLLATGAAPTGGGGSADGGKLGEPPAPDARFIAVETIAVPVVDGARLAGQLHIRLMIDAGSEAEAAALVPDLPRHRFALLAATLEFAGWSGTTGAPLDIARLAQLLQAAAPEGSSILIQQVSALNG